MIHIVEIHEHHKAHVWFAFNEEDFIRKVEAAHAATDTRVIFEQTTPRTLQAEQSLPNVLLEQLITEHGMDTPLYRADYLLGEGVYQATPVSPLAASFAAVATAPDFRIYANDEDAADELDREPLFRTKEGYDAGRKLRAQLVEMEVIAEDF